MCEARATSLNPGSMRSGLASWRQGSWGASPAIAGVWGRQSMAARRKPKPAAKAAKRKEHVEPHFGGGKRAPARKPRKTARRDASASPIRRALLRGLLHADRLDRAHHRRRLPLFRRAPARPDPAYPRRPAAKPHHPRLRRHRARRAGLAARLCPARPAAAYLPRR